MSTFRKSKQLPMHGHSLNGLSYLSAINAALMLYFWIKIQLQIFLLLDKAFNFLTPTTHQNYKRWTFLVDTKQLLFCCWKLVLKFLHPTTTALFLFFYLLSLKEIGNPGNYIPHCKDIAPRATSSIKVAFMEMRIFFNIVQ